MKSSPEIPEFKPLSRRRRLLLVALAVAMATTVMWSVLERPGAPPRAEPEPCAPGQVDGCVGGRAVVIVPAPAASR
jgi:hypothetical protein